MKRNQSILLTAAVGCTAFLSGVTLAESNGTQPANDAEITHRVVGKLAMNDPQDAMMIRVSTKDGVVTLRGMTYNGEDEAKVVRDTQSVEGVVSIRNRLSLFGG